MSQRQRNGLQGLTRSLKVLTILSTRLLNQQVFRSLQITTSLEIIPIPAQRIRPMLARYHQGIVASARRKREH
jgi:hypothetical protein